MILVTLEATFFGNMMMGKSVTRTSGEKVRAALKF